MIQIQMKLLHFNQNFIVSLYTEFMMPVLSLLLGLAAYLIPNEVKCAK